MSPSPKTKGFQPVPLYSVIPDEPLPFPIYVFFGERMILYRSEGSVLDTARYNRFICKQVCELYIPVEKIALHGEYCRAKEQAIKALLLDDKAPAEIKVARRIACDIEMITRELFMSRDLLILNQNIYQATIVAHKAVEAVLARPYLRIFELIPADSGLLITHSVRVSLLAVFLAYQLGHVNAQDLDNLAIAGLLHDVGKTRIKLSDDLENPDDAEIEAMKAHPTLGCELIQSSPHIKPETLRIIQQHHEHQNGSGYPLGVRGAKMERLSRILVIANTFDNLLCELKGSRDRRTSEALNIMRGKYRRRFDPEILPKALRMLAV